MQSTMGSGQLIYNIGSCTRNGLLKLLGMEIQLLREGLQIIFAVGFDGGFQVVSERGDK